MVWIDYPIVRAEKSPLQIYICILSPNIFLALTMNLDMRLFGCREVGGSEKVRSRILFLLENETFLCFFRCLIGNWEVKVEKYIVFSGVWLVM